MAGFRLGGGLRRGEATAGTASPIGAGGAGRNGGRSPEAFGNGMCKGLGSDGHAGLNIAPLSRRRGAPVRRIWPHSGGATPHAMGRVASMAGRPTGLAAPAAADRAPRAVLAGDRRETAFRFQVALGRKQSPPHWPVMAESGMAAVGRAARQSGRWAPANASAATTHSGHPRGAPDAEIRSPFDHGRRPMRKGDRGPGYRLSYR